MILEQMRRRTNEIFKEQMRRKWMCRGGNGCAEEEMDVQRRKWMCRGDWVDGAGMVISLDNFTHQWRRASGWERVQYEQ